MQDNQLLYVGGFELPDKNAAAQRVIANGKVFRELGYTVYYLSLDRTLIKKVPINQLTGNFEGFKYYKVKYPKKVSEWLNYLLSVSDVVKMMDELPNLRFVVAYNYPALALARLNRACKLRKVPLIADCSEWYIPHGGLVFKTIKGFDTYLRMRIVHPKLDGLIAISRYLYEFYKTRMPNVIQIPPLVDIESAKWKQITPEKREEVALTYAGFYGKEKKDRLDYILKALSMIKKTGKDNFSLRVVGLTKEQYLDDYGPEYLSEGMEQRVTFLGKLPHDKAIDEVKIADYAIFIRETNLANTAGFPTKLVEALSCGTPVLANLFSNISDYLANGVNGYVLDTTSEEAFVNTLSFALSQSKANIGEMKIAINKENVFDYRKYVEPIRLYLNCVSGDEKGDNVNKPN